MGFLGTIDIKIDDTHVISDYISKEDIVNVIVKEYRENSNNCIGEMLDTTEISGLSVQDTVDVFAKVMYEVENDELVQRQNVDTTEPNEIDRWRW